MIRKTVIVVATVISACACNGGSHDLESIVPTSPTSSDAVPAPGITAVAASAATTGATITWTTDAMSDSSVEYGPTEQYGAVVSGTPDAVTNHAVTIGGLRPGTAYQFRVRSMNPVGAVSTSGNHAFTTLTATGGPGGNDDEEESEAPARSVVITSPERDTTVAGTVTVGADARADRGVAGVQFKLDGADLGGEDRRQPYTARWNSKNASDGHHTLTAVIRDKSGDTATSVAVRVTVKNTSSTPSPNPSPSPEPPAPPPPPAAPPTSGGNSSWPGEPDGFRVLSDQSWNSMTSSGWNYLRRSSSKDDTIISDSSAPLSPQQMLRIIFTPDMAHDSGPSVHWMGLPTSSREMFTGWWMKLSPNWKTSPAGGGKITFLWSTRGQGQVYANIGGSSAPHRININTEWAPYGQKFWEPNVGTTRINYNVWYRVEWYVRWESQPGARDGIMRWWVNGTLNGDYRNVEFPAGCCFEQFEYAPTLQNPPPAEQYMYIDHTYVSAK